MAGAHISLFLLLFTFPFIFSAPSCIQIGLRSTGRRQGMDMEFEVEIKNICACAQREVRIIAPGFASQTPIDPGIFRRDGAAFLVRGGRPIPGGAAVRFAYWWDHAARFSAAGSLPACR